MPFLDTKDDVFPGESHSRRGMRLSTIMRPFRAQGGEELFAQMPQYLTAAKKKYLATDTAEGFVQRMRPAFPSSDGDVLLPHQLRFLFPKS